MAKKKLNVAIVGCGHISKKHFLAINEHQDEMQIIAICDNNKDVLKSHETKYNVKGYLNLEEMLKKEKLDLVVLCSPSGNHADQTKLCASYGIHIITEKPMATNWKDGLHMVKACKDAGVKLFVVKQNRKNPSIQYLKRAILEKRFGKIHMVHINIFWNRSEDYYNKSLWRGTEKLDGGAFMNQASHYVDLLHWLIGPIEKIQSILSTTRNIESEDTGILNIKWKNGTLGSMCVTMLTYKENFESSITVIGEKGTVKIGGVSVNEIQKWEFENSKDYDVKVLENNQFKSKNFFGYTHYYQNVVDVFFREAKPDVNGDEGLKTLEILIATKISYNKNKSVTLPLDYLLS